MFQLHESAGLISAIAFHEFQGTGGDLLGPGTGEDTGEGLLSQGDDGNQVVEIGYFNLADSTNAPINTGNYMVLFEKRNGNYAVVREMSASDMPLD